MLQLHSSLNSLVSQSTELPNIILMGNFNLCIVCSDSICQLSSLGPTYGTELNSLFLDVINYYNDIGLEQIVTFPTRNNHALSLVFSTLLI